MIIFYLPISVLEIKSSKIIFTLMLYIFQEFIFIFISFSKVLFRVFGFIFFISLTIITLNEELESIVIIICYVDFLDDEQGCFENGLYLEIL